MISQSLKETIKNALDSPYLNIEEIRGGFAKQVYKISTQDDSFVLYIWRRPFNNKLTENQTRGIEYLFPDGFRYFVHNTKLLAGLGIRVPYILASGHHDDSDYDYAIVECFMGQGLEDYMKAGGDIGDVAGRLTAVMERMAAEKRSFYGSPAENKLNNMPAVQLAFDVFAEELNIAAKFDNEVSEMQSDLLKLMQREMGELDKTERQEYSLTRGTIAPARFYP